MVVSTDLENRCLTLLIWHRIEIRDEVGSFTSYKNQISDSTVRGTYGFLSLSEKTRKCNRLQMSLRTQHFLLSFLKTLSVGPAKV